MRRESSCVFGEPYTRITEPPAAAAVTACSTWDLETRSTLSLSTFQGLRSAKPCSSQQRRCVNDRGFDSPVVPSTPASNCFPDKVCKGSSPSQPKRHARVPRCARRSHVCNSSQARSGLCHLRSPRQAQSPVLIYTYTHPCKGDRVCLVLQAGSLCV